MSRRPVPFLATVACIIAFIVGMMAINGLLTWLVPQLPEILQKMMGWFAPGFCAGYLFTRWRAVALIRAALGSAAAKKVLSNL